MQRFSGRGSKTGGDNEVHYSLNPPKDEFDVQAQRYKSAVLWVKYTELQNLV